MLKKWRFRQTSMPVVYPRLKTQEETLRKTKERKEKKAEEEQEKKTKEEETASGIWAEQRVFRRDDGDNEARQNSSLARGAEDVERERKNFSRGLREKKVGERDGQEGREKMESMARTSGLTYLEILCTYTPAGSLRACSRDRKRRLL